jgi:general secretion pathway protein A
MYNTFYGFKENPFDITPNSRFLFWSQKHQTAFRHLLYGVQSRKGLVLLTGEVGTGKTTLLNALIEFFKSPESKAKIIYLAYSKFNVADLFRYIFSELKLQVDTQNKSDYWIILKEFLVESNERGEQTLLVLDEAQNYAIDILEEIRLLLNLETPEGKLIQIILAGQPQLLKNIDSPELYQLKQRIGISYNLHPLNGDETKLYIQKRLDVAGAKDLSLFTPDSIGEIYAYSQGIPRIINILCDNALLFGYAARRNQIDADIVRQVAKNMDLVKSNFDKIYEPVVDNSEELKRTKVENDEYGKNYRYTQSSSELLRRRRGEFRENINYRNIEEEKKSKKRFALFAQITIIPSIILLAVLFARDGFLPRVEDSIKNILYNTYFSSKDYANINIIKDNNKDVPDNIKQRGSEQGAQDPVNHSPANYPFPALSPILEDEKTDGSIVKTPKTPKDINGKIVVVSMNDTFRDIVVNTYGEYNKTIIDIVLKANPEIKDTNTILIGQPIKLPNI